MQRIVVGVDGSEPSRRALRWAAEEARRREAILEIVHAWHPPYSGGYPYQTSAMALFERDAKSTLDGVLADPVLRGVPAVEPILVQEGAARAVLAAAKGADLLVVGSRGRGGFAGLLLGSVSQQVAQHAHCPVAIIPGP